MKSFKLTHLHAGVGVFNGTLTFLLDNRLLNISVSTPVFNDFNEWRIGDITFSNYPYDPSNNSIELEPYLDFEPIDISEKLVNTLDLYFNSENEFNPDIEVLSYPLLSSIKIDGALVHYVGDDHKELKVVDSDIKTDYYVIYKLLIDVMNVYVSNETR